MAGHGILLSGAEDLFRTFVEKTGIPVVFTLLGQGTFPESHPLALGLMGMHGHKQVNKALEECDLLVNIGARFDDRATGKVVGFAPKAKVVHVDIDPAEIGKNVRTDVPVVGDAGEVLKLLHRPRSSERATTTGWPGSTRSATGRWTRRSKSGRSGRSRTRSSRRSPRRPTARRSSPPMSASTRCGRPSTSASTTRTAG